MHPLELKRHLHGVIAFTPTPFRADEQPDLEALAEQVDFLCSSGVQSVVVCGGVGEFYALQLDAYCACIRTAVEAAQKRVPVLAGIGHSTAIACQLAAYAAQVGAAGLMINPLYFITPATDGLARHYRALAAASDLGMMIFSTRGAVYSVDELERLAEVENVIALKDECGDLRMFSEMVDRLGDRYAWINGMAETLAVPYAAAGAAAMTSGLVNLVPSISIAVWEAAVTGHYDEVRRLVWEQLLPLIRLRERRPGYHITVLKEALTLLGRTGGTMCSPLVPLTESERQELRQALMLLGVLAE